jgi:hypothetical protein
MALASYLAPINDEIKQAAQELLKKRGVDGYAKLRQIVSGKRKYVDVRWWREVNGVASEQVRAKQERDYQDKLEAIKAMADPARNPSEHQRHPVDRTAAPQARWQTATGDGCRGQPRARRATQGCRGQPRARRAGSGSHNCVMEREMECVPHHARRHRHPRLEVCRELECVAAG